MRRVGFGLALSALVLACEDDDGGVASQLDRLAELVEDGIALRCECLGAPCNPEIGADYRDCFVAALAGDAEAERYLDCAIDAERAQNACIDREQCDFELCLERYQEQNTECNALLAPSTLAKLDACQARAPRG